MTIACMPDEELVRGFEEASLESFSHADHVRVACAYLDRFDPDEALTRLVTGLSRFAAAKGKADKFHYTMTRAWLELILDARRHCPGARPSVLLERCPALTDASALSRFYSPAVLASAEARAGWVPPDRRPLSAVTGDDAALRMA